MLHRHSHPRQFDFKACIHDHYAVHPGDILTGTPEPFGDLNHLPEAPGMWKTPQKPEGSISLPFRAEGRLGDLRLRQSVLDSRERTWGGWVLPPPHQACSHLPSSEEKAGQSEVSAAEGESSAISHKQGDNCLQVGGSPSNSPSAQLEPGKHRKATPETSSVG